MNLAAPAALGLLALAVPLVVLYMLRSRYQRVTIPSTMLWARVGPTVSSAVPWQKLKFTALMLLQLLLLALFALLLARPFFLEQTLLGDHTVFVMDTSGSSGMAGRLEAAKARAIGLLEGAPDGALVSVIEAGSAPRVLVALETNTTRAIEAIDGLSAGGAAEDLGEAIRLARGLSTPDRPASILLFSDGGPSDIAWPGSPLVGVTHIEFDQFADNLGITAFSLDLGSGSGQRAFVEVANFGRQSAEVDLELDVRGEAKIVRSITVGPGEARRDLISFSASPGELISARLVTEDALPLDDAAWLVAGSAPERTVSLFGKTTPFIPSLISAMPGLSVSDSGGDILVVEGGQLPEIDRPAWLIRPETLPPDVFLMGVVQHTAASFQRPGEPILDAVDLSDLGVGEADIVEGLSWLPIVSAGDVPLVLLGQVNGHRVVYFTFDLAQSNLPVQISFPVFGSRILEYLGGASTIAGEVAPAGAPIAISPPLGGTVTIGDPNGREVELSGTATLYTATATPGPYAVTIRDVDGTVVGSQVVVRSFDPAESAGFSRALPTVAISEAAEEAGTTAREWAPWLLLAVLVIGIAEWWVGHQRPFRRVAA